MRRGFEWAALLLLCWTSACGDPDISLNMDPDENNQEELCAPTGRVLIDSGVYLGPDACEQVTLYRTDATTDYWLMSVAWPMYGEYWVLELTNRTTGDFEKELIYTGDPEFLLFSGDYLLGGFEVAEGLNVIDYKLYKSVEAEDGSRSENVKDEGVYELTVELVDRFEE